MWHKLFGYMVLPVLILGCAKSNMMIQDFSADQTMHYSQMESLSTATNHAVYLDKGDKIPVKVLLESDIVEPVDEQIELVLKQRVYFRVKIPEGINEEKISTMSDEEKQQFYKSLMILISADAVRWAPYYNVKAVKELFGLKGGAFSLGMGISKEDGINAFINVKTTQVDP